MPALQICYHDHCFDGVASAATFLRFYREKVKPGIADVSLRGMAHRAGQLFPPEAFAGDENTVVDFRFSPDPRLTWWFDHHQSAFETAADEAAFKADKSGRKFWDPTARSCTRFLAGIAEEKFGWDPAPLRELIDWAEVIDGALCPSLIRELSERPLSAVLREPWVTEPLQPLLARHHEVVKMVTARLRLEGGVATSDLADLGIDNVNKFIAYAANPDTLYTVSVSRGSNRSKISLGSNPWKQHLRRHNLARIAERYGGGGHPAVAAISFPPDQLEQARAAAAVIADELRRPQGA